MKLFVYGTLKFGWRANADMMRDSTLLQSDVVLDDHKMYTHGHYPCVVSAPGYSVVGEVWEVPDHEVERLDRYEGHPFLFTRVKVDHPDFPDLSFYRYANDTHGMTSIINGRWE